ncbi:MAG: GyrI-like domain-containing protein [Devosiaceae bacterium]|nr:GyrI-like domain-containing protein [Devosiaceae bacterium]
MEKIDFKKKLKELYQPTHKDFSVVTVPNMLFAMIDGEGAPEGTNFAKSVPWLYSAVYTIKFAAKKKMGRDFVVAPLEGLWWADDMDDFIKGNRDKWKWRLMIVLPEWADEEMFEEGVAKGMKKLGERPKSLRMEMFEEGLSVQIMHKGPFSEEGPVIARMHKEFIPQNGFVENGFHHEIYLNDARRTAPEKLKTVLRQPVKHSSNT